MNAMENTKYKVNDTIIYGANGICRISEISERTLSGRPVEYYILKPVDNDRATIFVPSDNEALISKMKPLLSAMEIRDMIRDLPSENTVWIEDEYARIGKYREIIANGDRAEIARLIRTLFLYKRSQKEMGRKVKAVDESMLKEAERVLHEEFAYVLHLKRDQVLPFIIDETRTDGAETKINA